MRCWGDNMAKNPYGYPEFISSTGYGTGPGLKGWNCYHDFHPFIPGVDEQNYTEEEVAQMNAEDNVPRKFGDKEYTAYEATQRQRELERVMRKYGEESHLLELGGADEDTVLATKVRYQTASQEYAAFSKAMGLPQQRERIRNGMESLAQYAQTGQGAGNPVVMTIEQAHELEAKHGLTFKTESDIMSVEEWFDKNKPLSTANAVPALRKQSIQWISYLSSEEKRAITKYSNNPGDKGEEKFYHRLNAMLRGEIPIDAMLQYYADNITNALRKFKMQSSIICYRGVNDNPLKGLSIGEIYVPKQYLSTSVTPKGALNKKFKMMILASPGTDGAYIEMLSEYPNQREFLFNDSCKYVIVKQEDDFAILEVIV